MTTDENQRKKRQQQQKQRKTNKKKHLKKIHNPWQHKDGTNTLVKLIRLMEVNGRQFYQNGSIRFGLLEVESHKNAEFEQEMISLEERVDCDREFTDVLNRQKLRFLHKCMLYNWTIHWTIWPNMLRLWLPACRVSSISR